MTFHETLTTLISQQEIADQLLASGNFERVLPILQNVAAITQSLIMSSGIDLYTPIDHALILEKLGMANFNLSEYTEATHCFDLAKQDIEQADSSECLQTLIDRIHNKWKIAEEHRNCKIHSEKAMVLKERAQALRQDEDNEGCVTILTELLDLISCHINVFSSIEIPYIHSQLGDAFFSLYRLYDAHHHFMIALQSYEDIIGNDNALVRSVEDKLKCVLAHLEAESCVALGAAAA